MNSYRGGIDIGSTTVKLVILDNKNSIVFGEYRRHFAHIQETLAKLLKEAKDKLQEKAMALATRVYEEAAKQNQEAEAKDSEDKKSKQNDEKDAEEADYEEK